MLPGADLRSLRRAIGRRRLGRSWPGPTCGVAPGHNNLSPCNIAHERAFVDVLGERQGSCAPDANAEGGRARHPWSHRRRLKQLERLRFYGERLRCKGRHRSLVPSRIAIAALFVVRLRRHRQHVRRRGCLPRRGLPRRGAGALGMLRTSSCGRRRRTLFPSRGPRSCPCSVGDCASADKSGSPAGSVGGIDCRCVPELSGVQGAPPLRQGSELRGPHAGFATPRP
mmetsp:Transcript_99311/g.195038  ORF Transcript_99311/g.195038 Transcript_99311/m.195038 type:complete len:226 (-) Transcript_99311:430-1107(-)